MNLCTDQFALMLAAPGQLVSVSHISANPDHLPHGLKSRAPTPSTTQRGRNLPDAPDLVLADPW